MRRFNDYLLMSQMLRRARFLLPLLFLVALTSFSVTISSVQSTADTNRRQPAASETPTTAEVCRETQKVLDQYLRELKELVQTRQIKYEEEEFRGHLSMLDKAIAGGTLIPTKKMDLLFGYVSVERPKHKIGPNTLDKMAGEMTVQERSAVQRSLRSVIHRELEEAANTTFDRLEDRSDKILFQMDLRRQRMIDLNCKQVLKDGTLIGDDENPPRPPGVTPCSPSESAAWAKMLGTWDAPYGDITFAGSCEKVSGYWRQGPYGDKGTLHRGEITGGRVNGTTVTFDYFQDWNNKTGSASYSLSGDKMDGSSGWGTLKRK